MVEPGTGQSGKRRVHRHLVDVKAEAILDWRAASESLSGGYGRRSRTKTDAIEFDDVARLRGDRGKSKRVAGGAEDIVGSSAKGTRTIVPGDDRGDIIAVHFRLIQQAECRRRVAQSCGRGRAAPGRGHHHGNGSAGNVVRRLKIDLIGTDIRKVCRFAVDRDLSSSQRDRKVVVPDGCFGRQVLPVDGNPLPRLDNVVGPVDWRHTTLSDDRRLSPGDSASDARGVPGVVGWPGYRECEGIHERRTLRTGRILPGEADTRGGRWIDTRTARENRRRCTGDHCHGRTAHRCIKLPVRNSALQGVLERG